MQTVLRFTWTGLAASFRQHSCICSTRVSVSSLSYRRLQSRLYQPRHPAMELVRPMKKQRTAAFVADADSPAVLSEETVSVQDPANIVSTSGEQSPARQSAASAFCFIFLLASSACKVSGSYMLCKRRNCTACWFCTEKSRCYRSLTSYSRGPFRKSQICGAALPCWWISLRRGLLLTSVAS